MHVYMYIWECVCVHFAENRETLLICICCFILGAARRSLHMSSS